MLAGFFLECWGSVTKPGNVEIFHIHINCFVAIFFFYGTCLVILIGRLSSLYIFRRLHQKWILFCVFLLVPCFWFMIFSVSHHLSSPLEVSSPLFTPAFMVRAACPRFYCTYLGGEGSTRTLWLVAVIRFPAVPALLLRASAFIGHLLVFCPAPSLKNSLFRRLILSSNFSALILLNSH